MKEYISYTAFETEDEVRLWKRDNCRDCQFESSCGYKDEVSVEMRRTEAIKIGYEDMGFGYISLHDTCRMKFPKRNDLYCKIGKKRTINHYLKRY